MRTLPSFLLFLFPVALAAQTTYLPLGHEDHFLLDRLETKSGRLSNEFFSTLKPITRKGLVRFLEFQSDLDRRNLKADSFNEATGGYPAMGKIINAVPLTSIDRYNIDHAISTSGEWAADGDGAIPSRRPILKHFYRWQPDFFRVANDNFFLSVNPVLALRGTYERNSPERAIDNPLFANSRGAEVRGRIANRVGFYTFFTDNQETPPAFVRDWVESHQAVPGADYYQEPKAGKYDYLLARGYVDFEAVKDHINVTFGHDKHFIGDGIRSLFLSDFASSGATFLRLNTRIWRLNYQNLYLELTPQYARGGDRRLPHKYATVHHLSVNATRWLNVGLFEATCFSRPNAYEFAYLNPVILYRSVERAAGSPDNAMLGLNFKAIALKRVQLYGQLLLDEFRFKELTAGNGWWANKFGLQGGVKYFDVAGLRNLDLQIEGNLVRPFTYTHYDTLANWTHYNQPLAHPLEAGFWEAIAEIRYQPVRNLYLTARGTFYKHGLGSTTENFGNNIFRSYNDGRTGEYGYGVISGLQSNARLLSLTAAYELRENLFLDLGITNRDYGSDIIRAGLTTTYLYGGIRLNMARRDYDFY